MLTFVPVASTELFLCGFPSMGCRKMPIYLLLQKNIILLLTDDS